MLAFTFVSLSLELIFVTVISKDPISCCHVENQLLKHHLLNGFFTEKSAMPISLPYICQYLQYSNDTCFYLFVSGLSNLFQCFISLHYATAPIFNMYCIIAGHVLHHIPLFQICLSYS